MEITRWMTRKVVTVKPLDSIQHARDLMLEHRVNQLPVVEGGRLVGIVTDRDLRDAFPSVFSTARRARRRTDLPDDPDRITVEMVMTANVLTLGPDATMEDAARLMRKERIGAIPIVEKQKLVGIVTRSDVLDAFVELAPSLSAAKPL
ncbi:MAG: hypothetical protein KatS3mg076_1025 [Candidatus Binatia bacterium]|nr:MAG: hypothetical protein KatS3mg076_1025 [Candidatus Binatia bacterium]